MQLLPQALPFEQILQHAPLGSTDHSMLASSLALGGGLASGSLDPALVMLTINSAARANERSASFMQARYGVARVG